MTARNQPPIIIEVAVINCGKYVGSLKTNSARYCSNNRSVRVLILPLTKEQLGDQDFPIILSKEDEIIHAFVSASLSEYKQERCLELLEEFKSAFTDIDFKVS